METDLLLDQYLTSGSSADFESLVKAHGPMVFGVALRSTRSRTLAEEVTQDVFIILARKAATIRETHKLGAWLHRTVIQCAANANRRETKRRNAMDQYANVIPKQENMSAKERSAWQDALPHLDSVIDQLPPVDREAVVFRFYEGTSFKEIARLHGKSEDTSRKRVYRALDRLAALLKRRGASISSTTLALGFSAGFIAEGFPMTSGKITELALAAKPAAFTNTLLIMSSYKLALGSGILAALIPIGFQWQANLSHAASLTGVPGKERMLPGNGELAGEDTIAPQESKARTSAEILEELEAHAKILNSYQCGIMMRQLMFNLRSDELPAALEAVRHFGKQLPKNGVQQATSALFKLWAKVDPEEAGRLVLEEDLGRLQIDGIDGLALGWVEHDLERLEKFIADLPKGEIRQKFESVRWFHLTYTDPTAAADKAFAIEDPSTQTETLGRVLHRWNDPAAALKWLERVEPSHRKDSWLDKSLTKLAQLQPVDAFEETMSSLEGNQRQSTLRKVFQSWAESEPERAFEAMLGLPGTVRNADIVASFAINITDVSTGEQYLQRLPAASDKSTFIRGLVENLSTEHQEMRIVTSDDIAAIRPLVEAMPPSGDRPSAHYNLAVAWSGIDFGSARDWYDRQPDIDPRMKDNFVQYHQP